MNNPQDNYTVIDLFCGAGGLSHGFQMAGYKVITAVDNNRSALDTYSANLGYHAQQLDLSQEADFAIPTVVIGGPPCQGFSSAGQRRINDQRNSLIRNFADTIVRLRPVAFVFENVEGFLTAEHGARVMELLLPLITVGYRIQLRKLNAANYGIPQHRKRVIAIGGLGWNPSFPEPTHSAYGAPGAHLATTELPLTPTIADALAGLPTVADVAPGIPQGHYSRQLTDKELSRIAGLKQGQTMRDLPDELKHKSYNRRALRRVKDGTPTEQRGGAPAGIRRLREDEPSKAITGGAITEFVHPSENRLLTLRECARLQTFPDTFTFHGSRVEQIQLIANAVPPLLAKVIAQTLMNDLKNAVVGEQPGALLSFVPTLSEGYSPILKAVTTLVEATFINPAEERQLNLWD